MRTKTYDIKTGVRGEIRRRGEVITYDLQLGPVAASKVHPLVLERLIRGGVAVEKKERQR